MRVLLVKTSSLGDLVHSFPALTDAAAAIPGIRFDWVVEEGFVELPAWHPAVEQVLPVALRRWRGKLLSVRTYQQWRAFRRRLREREYDLVLDAQGLLKSALLARQARGPKAGLDRSSAREPLAALAYDRLFAVSRGEHAITRLRRLFAAALDYPLPDTPIDYGLRLDQFSALQTGRPYMVFLHGTTWPSKHYPEPAWKQLAALAVQRGFDVHLPWKNDRERERALRIATWVDGAEVAPRMGLGELAGLILGAAGVIAVDTGLAHLACALARPQLVLYGPTGPRLTGVLGPRQHNLAAQMACVPCMKRRCRLRESVRGAPVCLEQLRPEQVMEQLDRLL